MKKLMLDTNAYTAFKAGAEEIIKLIQHTDIIGLNTVVLGELLGGFAHGSKEDENRQQLAAFLNNERVHVYPLDVDTANYYAHIYSALKKKGNPIPTNDLWIAATTLQHGSMLCTFDKHFLPIDGLIVATKLTELLST